MLEHLGRLFAFEGKKVLVTGAAGGVGRAAALAFAAAGADVALADLPARAAATDDVKSAVEALGRRASSVRMDVRDRASVDAAMAEVAE